MATTKETIRCPKCNKKIRVKVFDVLDNNAIESIISREIFTQNCSCGEHVVVEYPLKVIGSDYIIHFTPGEFNELESTFYPFMRICATYDDLKEKLLIFEDHFNDIVIEFIKSFLINLIDEKMKGEMTSIRYDGQNEENLIFYLGGVKKSIGCPISFYNEIYKKSKIKRIKKCVLVDEETFKSYFKLR